MFPLIDFPLSFSKAPKVVKSLACSGTSARLKTHGLVCIGGGCLWHLPLTYQTIFNVVGAVVTADTNNKAKRRTQQAAPVFAALASEVV